MGPPLVSFFNTEELKEVLIESELISTEELVLFDELALKELPPLVNPHVLPLIFGISSKLISAIVRNQKRYYREFEIRKKSGGFRTISSPRIFLKLIQWWILELILYKNYNLSTNIHGFIPGRSSFTNANIHLRSNFLLNIDIEDFFPSIKIDKVVDVFAQFGFPLKVAFQLARLCTISEQLPQGAPTSPAISNLAFSPIDNLIIGLCKDMGIFYSRYADDLSFSSETPLGIGFYHRISNILNEAGFEVNNAKTRFYRLGQRRMVTGFVINEKIQPPRKLRRKIRAMFHNASVSPKYYKDHINLLSGWASYVNSYDSVKGNEYINIVKYLTKY